MAKRLTEEVLKKYNLEKEDDFWYDTAGYKYTLPSGKILYWQYNTNYMSDLNGLTIEYDYELENLLKI